MTAPAWTLYDSRCFSCTLSAFSLFVAQDWTRCWCWKCFYLVREHGGALECCPQTHHAKMNTNKCSLFPSKHPRLWLKKESQFFSVAWTKVRAALCLPICPSVCLDHWGFVCWFVFIVYHVSQSLLSATFRYPTPPNGLISRRRETKGNVLKF